MNDKKPVNCLSAKEIGAVLGVTGDAVRIRATKERWPKIKIPGRGGKAFHYPVKLIPEPTRSRLIKGHPANTGKVDRSQDYLTSAFKILELLKDDGYNKGEIDKVLRLAKQALQNPVKIKS